MAQEAGAFKKHGVTVEMSLIQTSAAVPAIIAGELDAMEVSAAPVITSDVNGNEDLVMIASALNHPIIGLWTVNSITSAQQLKGEVVASDKPGTPVDYAAHLALSLLGLKASDVSLRPIGNSAAITGALLSGEIKAGMEAPPQAFEVEAKGFHLLQDLYSKPYQNVALVAKRSRLDQLAPALGPLVAAYREGILAWNNQPDLAKKVLTKYGKVTDQAILDKTYEFYTKTAPFEPSLQPTMEGIQAMADFLGETTVPKAKGKHADDFVDLRFVKSLPAA
jgi:NitT/TauT family transport system substrate-binding protein